MFVNLCLDLQFIHNHTITTYSTLCKVIIAYFSYKTRDMKSLYLRRPKENRSESKTKYKLSLKFGEKSKKKKKKKIKL